MEVSLLLIKKDISKSWKIRYNVFGGIYMDIKELEVLLNNLGKNKKTKDVDKLNKILIKSKTDVSFLKDIVLDQQRYHRTYFQVSLGLIKNVEEQF